MKGKFSNSLIKYYAMGAVEVKALPKGDKWSFFVYAAGTPEKESR